MVAAGIRKSELHATFITLHARFALVQTSVAAAGLVGRADVANTCTRTYAHAHAHTHASAERHE